MAPRILLAAALVCLASPALSAAAAKSDLLPADKRRTALETATRLSKPAEIPVVPADVVSPFSPPDFARPDPAEVTAPKAGASAGAATASSAVVPVGTKMSSPREVLETLTPLIPSRGTTEFRGEFLLTVEGASKPLKAGDVLNVGRSADEPKYPLEIVRITKTDFTLRYQGEVKTRAVTIKSPIK